MIKSTNLFLVVRKFYKIEFGLFLILQFPSRRLWTTYFFYSRRALVVYVLIILKLKNETQNFDSCV